MGLLTEYLGRPQKRKEEWDQFVSQNPNLAPTTADYNRGLQAYVESGQLPETMPQDVRSNIGVTQDIPNPGGSLPIRQLPTTEVKREDAPIRMGKVFASASPDTGSYEVNTDIPGGATILPANQFQKTPNYNQAQALAMASGDPAELVKAFPNGVPGHAFDKFLSYVTAKNTKGSGLSEKEAKDQDTLEENFRKGLVSIRGDASLHRVEDQRDAAITAYGTIDKAEQQGRALNPIEYVDTLGQIYKARTGVAPGEQVLQDMRQQTAKGNVDRVFTYFTGEQAPATTEDIMRTLKNLTVDMGMQADKLHEGYMKQHLLPPSRLEKERANRIIKEGRGLGFQEATGYTPNQKTSGPPQINSDAEFNALPSGAIFIDGNGQTHRKK